MKTKFHSRKSISQLCKIAAYKRMCAGLGKGKRDRKQRQDEEVSK